MMRTILLALALALGGGAPHLASLVDLVSAVWAADIGNCSDPDGATSSDIRGAYDPNGAAETSDIGNAFDPNG